MRLVTILSSLLAMIATTINSQNILIHKTNEKVKIDGDLTDWKIPFIGPFVIHNTGENATQKTFVSFAWNNKNLYIAYNCIDSKIVGTSQVKDSEIFHTNDLAEIFLDPDGDGQNYIEIGVNAFSTNYDLLLKCISQECGGWNTSMAFDIKGLEGISKINEDGYTVEIKIPFSSLKKVENGGFSKPKVGTKWKGNAFRIDYGNTAEYLALQPYKSSKFGFHQPQEFAVFEFVK